MTQITVARGLSQLKTLKERIDRANNDHALKYVGLSQGNKVVGSPLSVDEVSKNIQSEYDSVISLINQYNVIKAALVASNSNTYVEVGNKSMTVAAAIEYKNSIRFKEDLLNSLRKNSSKNKQQYVELDNKNTNFIETQISNLKQAGADEKLNQAIESLEKSLSETNKIHLIDPINIEAVIKSLEEEIDTFKAEVDFVLNTSNTNTVIEV